MSDRNIEVVQEIYAAFLRRDIPGIMQHVSEDLREFGVVSATPLVPWHMQISKKSDVPLFFSALKEAGDFTRFEWRDFAAGGDHVYCTVSSDFVFKRNGKKVTANDEMHRFTFKDGKVIAWRGSEDTAMISETYKA